MSELTVVIPAHGLPDRLLVLLRALDAQVEDGPLPVIVSDDGTPEPLADTLAGAALPSLLLQVVRSGESSGPGGARNRALERVTTPWVAFLDADEVPAPGWLARARGHATPSGTSDAVEGRLQIGDGERPTPFMHATEVEAGGDEHVAGNVVFRTELLRRLGGFDERFFDSRRRLHFREDADLFFRIERAGARVSYDPDLLAWHPPLPSSLWAPVKLARRYYFDPLLSREHPERFRSFVRTRRVGPVPLRLARHVAAVAVGVGALAVVAGAAAGTIAVVIAGGVLLVAGWLGWAAALAWRRRVRAADMPPLALMALLAPLTYLWHYYRGVVSFRHRPRL